MPTLRSRRFCKTTNVLQPYRGTVPVVQDKPPTPIDDFRGLGGGGAVLAAVLMSTRDSAAHK